MSLRSQSFIMSDNERSTLASKIKGLRASLISSEGSLSEKMGTLRDFLKKIDKKIVKNERLTPLMEKKAHPMEMRQALVKLDRTQAAILMEYLHCFTKQHVTTTRESGNFLLDNPSLQSASGNKREKVDLCLGQL